MRTDRCSYVSNWVIVFDCFGFPPFQPKNGGLHPRVLLQGKDTPRFLVRCTNTRWASMDLGLHKYAKVGACFTATPAALSCCRICNTKDLFAFKNRSAMTVRRSFGELLLMFTAVAARRWCFPPNTWVSQRENQPLGACSWSSLTYPACPHSLMPTTTHTACMYQVPKDQARDCCRRQSSACFRITRPTVLHADSCGGGLLSSRIPGNPWQRWGFPTY